MESTTGAAVLYVFEETRKSDLESRIRFRRYTLLKSCGVLFLVGILLLGSLAFININGWMSVDVVQESTLDIYNAKGFHDNVSSPDVEKRGINYLQNISDDVADNSQNAKLLKSDLSDNSGSSKNVLNKSENISITREESFDNVFDFESVHTTTFETNHSVSVLPTNNVNENCTKSLFDIEFVKTLTEDEKTTVEKLMDRVTGHLVETFCDASSEHYLYRWLVDRNWAIDEAEKGVLNSVAWRKMEKIDELFTEDFSYFEDSFPIFVDGYDYTGRYVVTMDASTLDLRKILLAGKEEQLVRYITRSAELSIKILREAQFKGQNVTQGILIINAKGANMKQHGCNKCLSLLLRSFLAVDEQYPRGFFKIFLINIPSELEWMLHLGLTVFPSYITDAVEIFGTNKQEWQNAVLEYIPANQIRPQFGGTKETDKD